MENCGVDGWLWCATVVRHYFLSVAVTIPNWTHMKLLISNREHVDFLKSCVEQKPKSITICSLGIWAGILPDGRDMSEWGPRFKSETRALLESMREVEEVNILVGLYEYKACKKPTCIDCERKYVLDLIRHVNHAEKFPEFKWRMTTSFHIKCALFFYNNIAKGIAGSRNFTDSSWQDVTVTLDNDDVFKLNDHIQGVWNKSKVINDNNVGEFIEEQKITAGL